MNAAAFRHTGTGESACDGGMRPAAHKVLRAVPCRSDYFFPLFPMLDGAKGERPAPNQDATSPARSVPELRLRDGCLSVTLFSRENAKKEKSYFIVPERSYRDADQKWVTTHLLHPEDLLPMSLLLQRAYSDLRVKEGDTPKTSA